VDQLEKEIELPSGQLMGLFNRIIRKVVKVTSLRAGFWSLAIIPHTHPWLNRE
jgi:hypothetical protein